MQKAKVGIFFFALFFYFFIGSTSAFAGDVAINEFSVESPQWVELYNKGSQAVDISGWFIDDDGGTEKYTIPSNTIINPGEFKVFESGNLNLDSSSNDEVKLLNGTSVEDSYAYTPDGSSSYGRQPDGTGAWVAFSSQTKGSTNNTATPVPTATPTPTITPSPTLNPTATSAPTPTRTPTPAPTSPPTSTPKPSTATSKPTTKPTSSTFFASNEKNKTPTAVLGENINSQQTPTEKPKQASVAKTLGSSQKPNLISTIAIVLGVIFLLSCGILGFRIYKERKLHTPL